MKRHTSYIFEMSGSMLPSLLDSNCCSMCCAGEAEATTVRSVLASWGVEEQPVLALRIIEPFCSMLSHGTWRTVSIPVCGILKGCSRKCAQLLSQLLARVQSSTLRSSRRGGRPSDGLDALDADCKMEDMHEFMDDVADDLREWSPILCQGEGKHARQLSVLGHISFVA